MRRWLFGHANLVRFAMGLLGAIIVSIAVSEAIVSGAHTVELRSCHRLNILRAVENGNWLTAYQILSRSGGADLRAFAGTLDWVPLTDCHRAVFSDAPPPVPVAFSQRVPVARDLMPGQRN